MHTWGTTQCRSLPDSFPLPPSYLPPFPPPSTPPSLFLSLTPLELSPLFLPALPLSTLSPFSSCENSVCVRAPRVCVLRRVLCVCTELCVFLSGTGVQPFISGTDCRQGNTQISLCSFLTHTPAAYWTLRRAGLFFCTKVGLCHCSLSAHKATFLLLDWLFEYFLETFIAATFSWSVFSPSSGSFYLFIKHAQAWEWVLFLHITITQWVCVHIYTALTIP